MISPVSKSRISSNAYLPIILDFKSSTCLLPSLISFATIYSSVPQSSSVMITSCDTSTSLLVKYPESAVLRAVSDRPFLEP